MKVGDYIRTKYGIAKIIKITNVIGYDFKIKEACDVEAYILDKCIKPYDDYDVSNRCFIEDIIKSSPNIIDLIEVGDYVNGLLVIEESGKSGYVELYLHGYWINTGEDKLLSEVNIESIVTKEQFESMKYKVGE